VQIPAFKKYPVLQETAFLAVHDPPAPHATHVPSS